MFTTPHHPDGADANPWYELRANKLYPTPHHPQRSPVQIPWYEILDGKVYPAEGHPHGIQPFHWFELKD